MKKFYQLENLDCANCAAKLETAIKTIEGIENASVNFMAQRLMVETSADIEKILAEIEKVIAKIEPDCELVR